MKYVYSVNDGYVQNPGGGMVPMQPGQVWFADDPFVLSRPDLFSGTPSVVHSTTGRQSEPPTPITVEVAGEDVAKYVGGRGRRRA